VREKRMTRPFVVDIPAGVFEAEGAEPQKSDVPKLEELPIAPKDVIELPKEDVEIPKESEIVDDIVPPVKAEEPVASVEDIEVPNRESVFGFRFPTVFVIRRPLIRGPFNSFPSFSQFSPFGGGFGGVQPQPQQRPQIQAENPNRYNMMNHMEDVMKRLQQQMSSLWGNLNNPSYVRPFRPVFPSIDSAEESAEDKATLNLDNLPANYSNSTSETKIVDGQVVQVNKTIHKISSGNNTSGFFHFQVINVRPSIGTPIKKPSVEMQPPALGSTETEVELETKPDPIVEKVTTEKIEVVPSTEKPVEKPSEDPSLNEVFEDEKKEIEDFPYLLNRFDEEFDEEGLKREGEKDSDYEILPSHPKMSKEIDLSGDIRVNKLMASKINKAPYLMVNDESDVELIDV